MAVRQQKISSNWRSGSALARDRVPSYMSRLSAKGGGALANECFHRPVAFSHICRIPIPIIESRQISVSRTTRFRFHAVVSSIEQIIGILAVSGAKRPRAIGEENGRLKRLHISRRRRRERAAGVDFLNHKMGAVGGSITMAQSRSQRFIRHRK